MENQTVRAIPFGKLRNWFLFQANQDYLVLVCSLYFVEAHSTNTSNFVVIYLPTRFPPGGLRKWLATKFSSVSKHKQPKARHLEVQTDDPKESDNVLSMFYGRTSITLCCLFIPPKEASGEVGRERSLVYLSVTHS